MKVSSYWWDEPCEFEIVVEPRKSLAEYFEEATYMELDNPISADITVGGQKVCYAFTPATSGIYTFSSNGVYDTYGSLYDSAKTELKANDDGSEDFNFSISYELTAGETYYLMVKILSSYETGSFTVTAVAE